MIHEERASGGDFGSGMVAAPARGPWMAEVELIILPVIDPGQAERNRATGQGPFVQRGAPPLAGGPGALSPSRGSTADRMIREQGRAFRVTSAVGTVSA